VGGTGQGKDGRSSPGKAVDGERVKEAAATAFLWWLLLRWSPAGSDSPCSAVAKRWG
jgi:hypothetical protein